MLNMVGICMLIAGFVGLFISILLAFLWKIPDLLDELSGKKAKRQIKRLKELNIGTGGIDGITTNELYEMLNNSGNLVGEDIGYQDLDEDDPESDDKKDPEEDLESSSGENSIEEEKKSTGTLENVKPDMTEGFLSVVVLEEKSSLFDLEVREDE